MLAEEIINEIEVLIAYIYAVLRQRLVHLYQVHAARGNQPLDISKR